MPVEKLEEEVTGESAEGLKVAPAPKKLPSFGKLRNASSKKLNAANNKSEDPFRFSGSGVDFKCKLIGIQDVPGARGDEMCAEAMKQAKAAVKLTGQHKQRITLNINLEGIKLLDEKTGTCMHQLSVGRISFIARDPSDSRAFGLVYGPPDSQHKFYGIKTQQLATQPVLSIRDMFQIVYDMKKQQINSVKHNDSTEKENEKVSDQNGNVEPQVDTLIDLQSELDHLQQGMEQLDSAANWASFNDGSNNTLGSADDLLSSKTNSSFATTNTSNSGDPFAGQFDAVNPPAAANQRPTFTIDSRQVNGTVHVAPPSETSPDPFDTSHVRHHLEGNSATNLQFVSTPLPPTGTTFTLSQGSPGMGADWSTQPSSVQAPSPNDFNQSSTVFDQSPLFLDSETNFLGKPEPALNVAATESALEISPPSNVEDAFSKLVGNLDSLIPCNNSSTAVSKVECVNRSSTPDPFHHVKNPVKPSINMLRGDTITQHNSVPTDMTNLDQLFGATSNVQPFVPEPHTNPFGSVAPAPVPSPFFSAPVSQFDAPEIPPRPAAPPIPATARPRPTNGMNNGNIVPLNGTANPFDSKIVDPFNDDFFK